MFYVDYSQANAIIKRFNLTPNDKEKIKEMDMDEKIRQIIYGTLGVLLWTYPFPLSIYKSMNIYINITDN